MERLPCQEMISEILIRLPAKSIHRFKCVSKTWHSLISSPQFISSFLSHSSHSWAILDRVIRVDPFLTHTLNLSLSQPPCVSSFSITPRISNQSESNGLNFPVLINGCDGLLLLAGKDTLFVCNPITRQWYQLPDPPHMVKFDQLGAVGLVARAVMGPNGPVLNFVVAEYEPIFESKTASLMTFSSEAGTWVVKNADYMLDTNNMRSNASFSLDEVMYWVDLSFGLVAWDEPFSREKNIRCRFLSLPSGCRRLGLEKNGCIGASGGEIQCLEVVENGGFLKLWRFKDCKEKECEWRLVYKVDLVDVWNDESYLACGLSKVEPQCMFFHSFEKDVGFFMVRDKVIGVNVREKKVVSFASYSKLGAKVFVMPFVIPSLPTSLPPFITGASEKDRGDKYSKRKKFNKVMTNASRRKIV